MSSSDEIIGHANPHTIKKFELIEKYVEAWAHKLLQNQYCSGLVFIDCMSNSGEYVDDDGKQVLARLFVLQSTSATLLDSTHINGLTCFLAIFVLPEQNI